MSNNIQALNLLQNALNRGSGMTGGGLLGGGKYRTKAEKEDLRKSDPVWAERSAAAKARYNKMSTEKKDEIKAAGRAYHANIKSQFERWKAANPGATPLAKFQAKADIQAQAQEAARIRRNDDRESLKALNPSDPQVLSARAVYNEAARALRKAIKDSNDRYGGEKKQ